jgi:hypothetical protein
VEGCGVGEAVADCVELGLVVVVLAEDGRGSGRATVGDAALPVVFVEGDPVGIA